eukprot:768399-Hanusia_phi.AAC.15
MGGTRFMLPDKIWNPIGTPEVKDNEQAINSQWMFQLSQPDIHPLLLQDTTCTLDGDTDTWSKQSSGDSSDKSRLIVSTRASEASVADQIPSPSAWAQDLCKPYCETASGHVVTWEYESEAVATGRSMLQAAEDGTRGYAWYDPTNLEHSIFNHEAEVRYSAMAHDSFHTRAKGSSIGWSEPEINFNDLNERTLIATLILAEEYVACMDTSQYESSRNPTQMADVCEVNEEMSCAGVSWSADEGNTSNWLPEDGQTETCDLLSESDIDDLDSDLYKMIDEHLRGTPWAQGEEAAYSPVTTLFV